VSHIIKVRLRQRSTAMTRSEEEADKLAAPSPVARCAPVSQRPTGPATASRTTCATAASLSAVSAPVSMWHRKNAPKRQAQIFTRKRNDLNASRV
jgi:hypothetical protein